LTLWALQERGVLRVSNAKHFKVSGSTKTGGYRIKDVIDFSVTLKEWTGQKWVGLESDAVQLEFVRLDPYVRERLQREGLDIDQLVYDELHRFAGNRP